jgi:methylamine dehydrogenase light chain
MSLDSVAEKVIRTVAQSSSRRGVLARLGQVMVGVAALPLLPVDRTVARAAEPAKREPTETDCDYWRYCAVDGKLCSCCGGSVNQCPPGSEPSAISWIGTCLNPADGRRYTVSYNDCCGMASCSRCTCSNSESERPAYELGVHNDINWCMANTSTAYSCTISAIVGVA